MSPFGIELPGDLAEIIDVHRNLFGGFKMMADDGAGEEAGEGAADAAGADAGGQPDGGSKPPWGSDEEFDPQKAWNLIENLRTEAKEAKAKVREHEDAKLSEQEKLTRDLEESRTSNTTLAAENAVLKAVISHPELTADDIELLQGLPADAIADRAAKLAARLGSGTPTKPLSPRPAEALRGGTDPTNPAGAGTDWLRAALANTN